VGLDDDVVYIIDGNIHIGAQILERLYHG